MQKKEESGREKHQNFMSRNVTEFRHLMDSCYITEKDLDWVMNLRGKDSGVMHPAQQLGPPSVYFKQTKTSEIKAAKVDKGQGSRIVASQFDQIFLKNAEKSHHTGAQLHFYGSLRNSRVREKMSHSISQKSFSTIPFKDRQERPKFIKKEHINSDKPVMKQQLQDSLDGAHRQQPYTENILSTKNSSFLRTFTKVRGRNQVSLPTLAWQVGLRNYR